MIKNPPSIKTKPAEQRDNHGSKTNPDAFALAEVEKKTDTGFSNPSNQEMVKDMHTSPDQDLLATNPNKTVENFQTEQEQKSKNASGSFYQRFISDGNFRSVSISGINAFLHSLTVATSFTPGLKKLNEIIDKAAFFCTKIVSPYVSYGFSAWSCLKDKKPIEALIKIIPPAFLPFVGDANVDTVFGTSTGFNQPYDVLQERIKQKMAESPKYAKQVKEKNQTSWGNAQLILEEAKEMFQDFFAGKLDFWKESGYLINCAMILGGSLPMLLFARQERDTMWARGFGILRNIGGIMGDALFVSQKANFHKLLVGILCSLGAVSNITKRLVPSETLARIFIHLGAALDVAGYTVWNAFSDKDKDKEHQNKASLAAMAA